MRETLEMVNKYTPWWSRPFGWLVAVVCYIIALFAFWRDCAKERKKKKKSPKPCPNS